ncbi:MAG: hypothetical protein MHPSP_000418, partial [Paramarteilia canceri]
DYESEFYHSDSNSTNISSNGTENLPSSVYSDNSENVSLNSVPGSDIYNHSSFENYISDENMSGTTPNQEQNIVEDDENIMENLEDDLEDDDDEDERLSEDQNYDFVNYGVGNSQSNGHRGFIGGVINNLDFLSHQGLLINDNSSGIIFGRHGPGYGGNFIIKCSKLIIF